MAIRKHVLLAFALSSVSSLLHAEALISEIHYDNMGTDTGEGVEISASDGTSVSGWRVIRYNGADGRRYGADLLVPAMASAHCSGYSTYNIPVTDVDGIQNGSPDGLALVDGSGRVVQFLSYEGVFTAMDGPAAGMASADIGASESGSGKSTSLQLTGNMKMRSWMTQMATFGACNDGLVLSADGPVVKDTAPRVVSTVPENMTGGLSTTPTISVTFDQPVQFGALSPELDAYMLGLRPIELYCDNSYRWTLAQNVPYRIASTDNRTFTITPSELNPGDRCSIGINLWFITNTRATQYAQAWSGMTFYTASTAAAGYYSTVSTTSAAALRSSLHTRIKDQIRFPYTYPTSGINSWAILKDADEDPLDSTKILDVYHNRTFLKSDTSGTYNREHAWPKSIGFPCSDTDAGTTNDFTGTGRCNNAMDLMFRPNSMYTDMHMLHLSETSYNTERGSKVYASCRPSFAGGPGGIDECRELPTDSYLGRGGGMGVYPGQSNWVSSGHGADQQRDRYEVWIGSRGDMARAIFYMDIRYEGGTNMRTMAREPDLRLTNDQSMINYTMGHMADVTYMGLECDLVRWHEEDPVDTFEIRRNDRVQNYQTNRNPFIDHPEWVRAIYGADCPRSP